MSDDSLNANRMNVRPGGKQPVMRDTEWGEEGSKVIQKMVFKENHPLAGIPKGLRQVISERYGSEYTKGKKQDELVKILSEEEDFKNEKSVLAKEAETRGDIMIKGVKFHPELMPIGAGVR